MSARDCLGKQEEEKGRKDEEKSGKEEEEYKGIQRNTNSNRP